MNNQHPAKMIKISPVNPSAISQLNLSICQTLFGLCGIAEFQDSLLHLSFSKELTKDLSTCAAFFKKHFPSAKISTTPSPSQNWPENISSFLANKKPNSLKLSLCGSSFQLSVWLELLKIPHGETRSYQDISNAIGRPKANRAVGTAVGKNPISIFIPCHRVIKSNGSTGNYAWGPSLKKTLLKIENNPQTTV